MYGLFKIYKLYQIDTLLENSGSRWTCKKAKLWKTSLKFIPLEFYEICQFAIGHPVTSFSSKLATTIISQKRWIAEPSGNGVTNEICTTT